MLARSRVAKHEYSLAALEGFKAASPKTIEYAPPNRVRDSSEPGLRA